MWEEATGVGVYSAMGAEQGADNNIGQQVHEEEGTMAHLEMDDNMEENVGAGMEMAELTVEEPQAGVPEELMAIGTGADEDELGGGGHHDVMEDLAQATHDDARMAKLEALAALSELEESQQMEDEEEHSQETGIGYRPMRPKALNALTANAHLISNEDEQAKRRRKSVRRRRLLAESSSSSGGRRRLASLAAMHGLQRWKGKGGPVGAAAGAAAGTAGKASSTSMLVSTAWTAEDDTRYHAMVVKVKKELTHTESARSLLMFPQLPQYQTLEATCRWWCWAS